MSLRFASSLLSAAASLLLLLLPMSSCDSVYNGLLEQHALEEENFNDLMDELAARVEQLESKSAVVRVKYFEPGRDHNEVGHTHHETSAVEDLIADLADLDASCFGGDNCCTYERPCKEDHGDCDYDQQCEGNLVCGEDNCDPSNFPGLPETRHEFNNGDDCCVHPDK